MTGDPLPVRLRSLAVPAALLASAALVVVLALQARSLRHQLRTERARAVLPAAGSVVPPVSGATLAGDSVLLGEGPPGSRQLVFVFNTQCGVCVAALPLWAHLTARLTGQPHVSVVGWSQDSDSLTRAYVAQHDLRFDVLIGIPSKYLRLYRAEAVPSTFVLDEEGNVLYGRGGLLTPASEDSIIAVVRRAP